MSFRVRFAPSPTGPLHPGGVRTALYNYLFAKKHNGSFILRIEDTDQTRFVPGAEQFIQDSLAWCGIHFDEGITQGGNYGPYRQSERKALYQAHIQILIDNGSAYYAFDTPEALEQLREQLKQEQAENQAYCCTTRHRMTNQFTLSSAEVAERLAAGEHYVVRFKMPENREIHVHDQVRGIVTFQSNLLDDKVLFKSDGMPTYHLANVVDDYHMKITHVIRGEEWLSSTPLHVLLYEAFGWESAMPQFAHLPLLLKPDGNGKLSKRDGDKLGFPFYTLAWNNPETQEISEGYKEKGYLPQAYINFLAFLGWNPGNDQEIYTINELIHHFSLDRVHKQGARYDFHKLNWFNAHYIHNLNNETLGGVLLQFLAEKGINITLEKAIALCSLAKERWHTLHDCLTTTAYLLVAPTAFDQAIIAKKWTAENLSVLTQFVKNLKETQPNNAQAIETIWQATCENANIKANQVLQALRLALTGVGGGPLLFPTMDFIGLEESCNRINYALETL